MDDLLQISGFSRKGKTDDETDGKAYKRSLHTVGAYARSGTGRAEVMRHGRTGQHAESEYGGIAVAFTGHEKLSAGASAGQSESESGRDHAEEVPQAVGMGHGLTGKTGMESAREQIGDNGCAAPELR